MSRQHENTTGFIIKLFPTKDADVVLHLLTTKGTRLNLYARGVRKPNSRKAHSIDLLNLVSLSTQGSKTDLAYINEAKLLFSPRSQLQSLPGLIAIQLICELVDRFVLAEQEQPLYFIWLESLVKLLGSGDNSLLIAAFALKLLQHDGVLPDLKTDSHSGEIITDQHSRQLASGGDIGYIQMDSAGGITDRIVKTQLFMVSQPLTEVNRLKLTAEEVRQILKINLDWLEIYTEVPLKSRQLFTASLVEAI